MAYFTNVLADLDRLSKQLDCRHIFVDKAGYRLCMSCNYKYDVCAVCAFPTVNNDCDWC